MQRIDESTSDKKELLEALRGEYGNVTMSNGITARIQGGLLHFQGFFDGKQDVIEIPKVPSRVPVTFSGDNFSCSSLAEPNSGFVKVPTSAKGKRFIVLATAILNT